jgi:hypothetical protein
MGLFPDSVVAQIAEAINNAQATTQNKGRSELKKSTTERMPSKQVHLAIVIDNISLRLLIQETRENYLLNPLVPTSISLVRNSLLNRDHLLHLQLLNSH